MNVYDDVLRHVFSRLNLLTVPRLRTLNKRFLALVDEYLSEEENKLPSMEYSAPERNKIGIRLGYTKRKRWYLTCRFNNRLSRSIYLDDLENGSAHWMDRDCMIRIASAQTIAVRYCIWWNDEVDIYEYVRRIPDEWPTFSLRLEFPPSVKDMVSEALEYVE